MFRLLWPGLWQAASTLPVWTPPDDGPWHFGLPCVSRIFSVMLASTAARLSGGMGATSSSVSPISLRIASRMCCAGVFFSHSASSSTGVISVFAAALSGRLVLPSLLLLIQLLFRVFPGSLENRQDRCASHACLWPRLSGVLGVIYFHAGFLHQDVLATARGMPRRKWAVPSE